MIIRKPAEAQFDFEGATFFIRQLTPGQRLHIGDISISKKMEIRTNEDGKREAAQLIEPNPAAEREFVVKTVVTGWEGVKDTEGNDLPCTDENKLLLLDAVDGFYDFLFESLNKLDENAAVSAKAEEKNS